MRLLIAVAIGVLTMASPSHAVQLLTASGEFIVPSGVTEIEIGEIGAGGGGGGGQAGSYGQPGGSTTFGDFTVRGGEGGEPFGAGGRGEFKHTKIIVTPGQKITFSVGVGGSGGDGGCRGGDGMILIDP